MRVPNVSKIHEALKHTDKTPTSSLETNYEFLFSTYIDSWLDYYQPEQK